MDIEQIAKTCHSVHRAYCLETSNSTQPIWDEVESKHKEVVINSIEKILNDDIRSPEESHINFVKEKLSQGWTYNKIYSLENKTNPRLVDFDKLSEEHRMKEILFFECVSSFKK